jgi:ATP-dependent RNA helicase RhlE
MENSFEQFDLNRQILSAIADSGFVQPTQIQIQAIPLVLQGHDLLGIAQTGTGKTGAYLWPILMKVKYATGQSPRALIVVPTRELALQVFAEAQRFGKYTDLRIQCVYGGTGQKSQIQALESGCDILIGTPGRIWDLYKLQAFALKTIKIFVLDEADKMMDMGFYPQIMRFLEIVPSKRQNLLFSATLAPKVERLIESFLEAPIKIEVTPQATTADTVSQSVYFVPNFKAKIDLLAYLLQNHEEISKAIIFAKTRKNATEIFEFLSKRIAKNDVKVIHANKDQNARLNAINTFKETDLRLLVATDVAARGIDVSHLSHVINFDVPIVYEDYVHRIGRTGRAFNKGESITFCNEAERYHLRKIEKLVQKFIPEKPVPPQIAIEPTPFEEKQSLLKEIDKQKRAENPEFRGAFHEKKYVIAKKEAQKKRVKKPFNPLEHLTQYKKKPKK